MWLSPEHYGNLSGLALPKPGLPKHTTGFNFVPAQNRWTRPPWRRFGCVLYGPPIHLATDHSGQAHPLRSLLLGSVWKLCGVYLFFPIEAGNPFSISENRTHSLTHSSSHGVREPNKKGVAGKFRQSERCWLKDGTLPSARGPSVPVRAACSPRPRRW